MHRLEVFFDYVCPFCMRAHEYLKELYPHYPQIEIIWRPCEAHPRPERYAAHSDLCIQGMFFALGRGADIWAYHERMFRAALKERTDIEDIHALAGCLKGLLDTEAFISSLEKGEYAPALREANRYAYDESGVWVVPAYRLNGRRLDSIENIGVTKKQLRDFMDAAIHS